MGGTFDEGVTVSRSRMQRRLGRGTSAPSSMCLPALLHGAQDRVAIAGRTVPYDQPPHPNLYLGDGMRQPPWPDVDVR